MKPLSLEINGLHSFREKQQLDFTTLCQGGVFGIFGPTGSGKSTVLDAITLALYGKVERAKGGTKGIINQNEEQASVKFSFVLGEKIYTAQRIYKKGADNSVNLRQCRLTEKVSGEEETVLAERSREMDDRIRSLIGLTVEDFTRAVVLPQGKFAEFLSLQGKERRTMLQRLFSLDKYGDGLNQKVRNQKTEGSNQLDIVAAKKSVLGDASKAAVTAGQAALSQAKERKKLLEEQNQKMDQKQDQYKQVRLDQEALGEATKNWQGLAEKEPEIEQKKEKLVVAQRAEVLRPFLQLQRDEAAYFQKAQSEEVALAEELQKVTKDHLAVQQKCLQGQEIAETRGKLLETQLVHLEQAVQEEENWTDLHRKWGQSSQQLTVKKQQKEDLAAQSQSLSQKREEWQKNKLALEAQGQEQEDIAKRQEEVEVKLQAWRNYQEREKRDRELQNEVAVREKSWQKVKKEAVLWQEQVEKGSQRLTDKKKEMTGLVVPQLSQQELNQRIASLNEVALVIAQWDSQEKRALKGRNDLKNIKAEIQSLQQEMANCKEQNQQWEKEKDQLTAAIKSLTDKMRQQERENLAALLGGTLLENQPCPVCGSCHHPCPTTDTVEAEKIDKLKGQLFVAEEKQSQLETIISQGREKQGQLSGHLTAIKTAQAQRQLELAEIEKNILETVGKLPQTLSTKSLPEWQQWQQKENDYLKTMQQAVDSFISSERKLKDEIEDINQKLQMVKDNLVQKKAAEETMALEKESLQKKLLQVETERKEAFQAFQFVAQLMTGEEVEKQMELVKQAQRNQTELRHKEKKAEEELNQTTEKLLNCNRQQNEAEQECREKMAEIKALQEQMTALQAKIQKTTQGRPALEVQKQCAEQLAEIKQNLKLATELNEQLTTEREEKRRQHFAAKKNLTSSQKRLEQRTKQLQQKMQELEFVTVNQGEMCLLADREKNELQTEIENFQRQRDVIKSRIAILKTRLKEETLTEEIWQEFLRQRQLLQQELEEAVKDLHSKEEAQKKLQESHQLWLQLEKEEKTLASLNDRLDILEKLFKGNRFVEFIAEEQLVSVAVHASATLGELTHYRYALEVDSEGGFVIRDDANGGLRRPVSSLSGGETFLTSLALALALSGQIQLRGEYPLEFFFLDEGFGTLDNYLLETVMNALERLQGERMTIGIISHVPELRARIGRRLIVEPAEKGGRGTLLQVERG